MAKVKVLFLLESIKTPSSRLRVLNFLPLLDDRLFEWQVEPIPNSILKRPALFSLAKRFDVVFVQKKLFRAWEWGFLTKGAGMVYDFDDAVMLPGRDKYDPDQPQKNDREKRFAKALASAKVIIAGSDYLKGLTNEHATRTRVIPTTVDTAAQPVKTGQTTPGRLVLGWIGTKGNLKYLEELSGVLARLSQRHPGLVLKMVCDGFIEPPGVAVEKKPWSLEDEAQDLVDFDIGLMPLRDDPWTRGKCGFKIIQYMAAGVPTVASPVSVNQEIIEHGQSGFLAGSEQEWEKSLERLIQDPELRARMGLAGRRRAEQEYDLRAMASRFSAALAEAAGIG